MLVQNKSSDDYRVETESDTKVQKLVNKLRPRLDNIPVRFYKNKSKTLFSPSWFGFSSIVDKINEINIERIQKDPDSSYYKGLLKVDLR